MRSAIRKDKTAWKLVDDNELVFGGLKEGWIIKQGGSRTGKTGRKSW